MPSNVMVVAVGQARDQVRPGLGLLLGLYAPLSATYAWKWFWMNHVNQPLCLVSTVYLLCCNTLPWAVTSDCCIDRPGNPYFHPTTSSLPLHAVEHVIENGIRYLWLEFEQGPISKTSSLTNRRQILIPVIHISSGYFEIMFPVWPCV